MWSPVNNPERWSRLATSRSAIALVTLLLAATPITTSAQSQETGLLGKEGLVIGLGLGVGYTSINIETTQFGETTTTTVDNPTITADFKFGGGLSERVLLYWFGKGGWFHGDDSFGVGTETSTVVALSGVGASYWITDRVSLGGGVGVTSLTNTRETDWGPGFVVGAEYEFKRHLLVNLDFLFGTPDPEQPSGVERSASTFLAKLSVNWLYY